MNEEELLKEAAKVYDKLTQDTYIFITGRKGVLQKLILRFTPDQFKHIAGLHKSDVMKNRPSGAIFRAIKENKFKFEVLTNSSEYSVMVERWRKMLNLPEYLNSFHSIYKYDYKLAQSAGIRTDIKADYLIACENGTVFIFLVIDRKGNVVPLDIVECQEEIKKTDVLTATLTVGTPDYTKGQSRPSTVLYKERQTKSNGSISKEIILNRLQR